ncbi:MAG: hypothetical protein LUE65_11860 [Clostridiales bacterium]|nr:hypothetical protein [Clostridiales bacterium]
MYVVMEKRIEPGTVPEDDFTLKPFKSLIDFADYMNKGVSNNGGDLYEIRLYELMDNEIFKSKFYKRKVKKNEN